MRPRPVLCETKANYCDTETEMKKWSRNLNISGQYQMTLIDHIKHTGMNNWPRVITQSINKFISRHSTEACATVRLCRIKEKCLETNVKCVNGWSSSTVQWKRVPESRSSNRETTSSSVQVIANTFTSTMCFSTILVQTMLLPCMFSSNISQH